MLNKKKLFNLIYAFAFVGAVISCFSILNEFINLMQLRNVIVRNLFGFSNSSYFIEVFFFYLITFLLSAFCVVMLTLSLLGVLKQKHVLLLNVSILIACAILLVLSFSCLFVLASDVSHPEGKTVLRQFEYTLLYAFRSVVFSFLAHMAIILSCHLIEYKTQKKAGGKPAGEQ